MRKPVVVFVIRQLFLFAAIWFHAPDLHTPAADRIEVNILAVRRILWPIVQSRRGRELNFVSSLDRDAVNVELAVALPGVDHELPVW